MVSKFFEQKMLGCILEHSGEKHSTHEWCRLINSTLPSHYAKTLRSISRFLTIFHKKNIITIRSRDGFYLEIEC